MISLTNPTFLSAELFPQPNCFEWLLRFLCFFFQFISNCPGAESPNLQLTLLERMLTVKASGGSLPKALQFPLWGCVCDLFPLCGVCFWLVRITSGWLTLWELLPQLFPLQLCHGQTGELLGSQFWLWVSPLSWLSWDRPGLKEMWLWLLPREPFLLLNSCLCPACCPAPTSCPFWTLISTRLALFTR